MDQIILLRLGGDDLVKRAVLVEQQVRISVSQDPRALGCEHEQLVASVGYEKGPTPVFASIERMAGWGDLLLARLVTFPGSVLVAFRPELIGRMIPDGRQGLHHRLRRRGLGRRRLGRCYILGWRQTLRLQLRRFVLLRDVLG